MTSYELLELLEFMPDESAFRTAVRGGEYPEARLEIRHLVSEVARLRATMHAVHGGQRYEAPVLLSKAQQRAEVEDVEAAEERREEFFSLLDRDSEEIEVG